MPEAELREKCFQEIAGWYVENRRPMAREEFRSIASKYFGTGEALTEFYNYLASPEGGEDFNRWLKLAAWKVTHEDKFPTGQIVMTRGISDEAAQNPAFWQFITRSLERHKKGDWGSVGKEDWAENELSLKKGFRLFSVYEEPPLRKIWIITEADRSATTILFPEEY